MFFEKIHNIHKPLARLIKEKKKSGLKSIKLVGFPGGSVVKNPPARAGDAGERHAPAAQPGNK